MSDIRHAIVIDVAPKKVFPLVSSGKGLKQWWAEDVSEDGESGSVSLGFFNKTTLYRLKPLKMVAPREAEWLCETGDQWSGTRLIFHLSPSKNSTQIHFSHADWRAETDYFVSCNTTWGELMFRLKAAAEGKKPGPLFSATGMSY